MPTTDRRPRRRVKPKDTPAPEPIEVLYSLARTATAADWDAGLRRRFVRLLVQRGQKPERAAKIVAAFEKRPELIPGIPPAEVVAEMRAMGKIK